MAWTKRLGGIPAICADFAEIASPADARINQIDPQPAVGINGTAAKFALGWP